MGLKLYFLLAYSFAYSLTAYNIDEWLLCSASVHFDHSAHLVTALTAAGVDYRLQVYPDSPHAVLDVLSSVPSSTRGPGSRRAPADAAVVRRHVLRTIRAFLRSRCRRRPPAAADDDDDDEQTTGN